jgi:hypothetical protein
MGKPNAEKKKERGEEECPEKKLYDLLAGFNREQLCEALGSLDTVLDELLGDRDGPGGPPPPTAHEILDPAPPQSTGLPIKTVIMINGNGCIELIGQNDTGTTIDGVSVPLDRAKARIFRVTDTITAPPADDSDPRYIEGTLDQYGMYYRFTNAGGNPIPGALSNGSDNNIVQTWARQSGDTCWTPSLCYRQFVGCPTGGGFGYTCGSGSGSSGGGGSGSGGSGSGGP